MLNKDVAHFRWHRAVQPQERERKKKDAVVRLTRQIAKWLAKRVRFHPQEFFFFFEKETYI